ncbi:MAG: tRNA pseudouridine(38-40) synthase TruA [Rhizobiales bacterium]|nr:tRNA pseudouridine(38-40) synthase TruA [Hyphomicrobiales bacterium]
MTRYKLIIEYDGGPFVGWQTQANGPSVQSELEAALARFTGEAPLVHGAGRTDAGVHALGQVAHFDLEREWQADVLCRALNAHLRPNPISVLSASLAAPDFHARFSATARHYVYRILNRRSPPALERGHVWWHPVPLDAGAMHEGAQHLTGKHDFTTFRAAQCQSNSPVKTLDRLDVARYGEAIEIRASARSFLHHQVRSIVGTLKLVGEGKWRPADVKRALDARDRAACGPVAPPHGLFLLAVDYGDDGQARPEPK